MSETPRLRWLRQLAPFAARSEASRGRRHPEPEHSYRDLFERDRDRIIHSRAFRRLEYKTQVFPNYVGDHFRTRLTHTIEVAQIARTAARSLGLNPTLAEAISLAHDLGHPPFGHSGEAALDEILAPHGGFEHNRQSLRIVEEIEERYASFDGLNLTYEVREGIVKHDTRYDRFRHDEIDEYRPDLQPLLEAQIIDWVDEIAYNVHDLDDGVESHILVVDQLVAELPLFSELYRARTEWFPDAEPRRLFNETIRGLLDHLVTDLIHTTARTIDEAGVDSVDAVRRHEGRLVRHTAEGAEALQRIGDFLHRALYRNPGVVAAMQEATEVVRGLAHAYLDDSSRLPPRHRRRADRVGLEVAVADYVAGMTDRYAFETWVGMGAEQS